MRHVKRHIRRNVKAISPVLAVLMMIAVAIGGSLVVYAWVMGYIGLSTERSGQAIMIQSIANDVTDTDLLVFVQNVGEGVVQLDETSCLYINGEIVECAITIGTEPVEGLATLEQGETATLTYEDGAALPGQKVTAKVTTLLGTSAEAHEYPAGSARTVPVLDHFSFDQIGDQIVNVPFDVTITAMTQYNEIYTAYNGVNNLTFSDGDITPDTTQGGFVGGIWNGEVSVSSSATGARISTVARVENGAGISNPFDVYSTVIFISTGDPGRIINAGQGGYQNIPPGYPEDMKADDLILLQVCVRDTVNTPTTPQDFDLLFGPITTGDGNQWIYYKWSSGSETGTLPINVPGGPTNVLSQMYAFRYVRTTGFTEGETFVENQVNDIIYAADVTTGGGRRLAVTFVYATDNPEIGSFTGEETSGYDWERQGYVNGDIGLSNEDAFSAMQTALMVEQGTITGGTFSRVDVVPDYRNWCLIAFALIPNT